MTKVVSFYAGPGSGKSTTAAALFVRLKTLGISTELVTEYVKDVVWDKRGIKWYDQPYFLGKQWKREAKLYGNVDYAITDSPLELSAIYGKFYTGFDLYTDYIKKLRVMAAVYGTAYCNVFINRSKPYVNAGRNESEEQAIQVDSIIKNYLYENKMPFIEVNSNAEQTVDFIQQYLGL